MEIMGAEKKLQDESRNDKHVISTNWASATNGTIAAIVAVCPPAQDQEPANIEPDYH